MAAMPQDMQELVDEILGTDTTVGFVHEPGNDWPDEVFNLATMVREFFQNLPEPIEPEPVAGEDGTRWYCERVVRDHHDRSKFKIQGTGIIEPNELRSPATSQDAAVTYVNGDRYLEDEGRLLIRVSQLKDTVIHKIGRTVDVQAEGTVEL